MLAGVWTWVRLPPAPLYLKNVDDLNVFSVLRQVCNVTSRHLKDGNINFSSMGKIAYTLNSYLIEFLAFQRSVRLTFHHSPNLYLSKKP